MNLFKTISERPGSSDHLVVSVSKQGLVTNLTSARPSVNMNAQVYMIFSLSVVLP